jgi:hypothetical protein
MRIGTGSVVTTLRVSPPSLCVDEHFASAMLALRPHLAHHVCKQQGYGHFSDTIVGATLPHLVEHLAIDLLVEEAQSAAKDGMTDGRGAPEARAGTTNWLNLNQGLMEVRISLLADTAEDATKVRTAIDRAIALVNGLLAQANAE